MEELVKHICSANEHGQMLLLPMLNYKQVKKEKFKGFFDAFARLNENAIADKYKPILEQILHGASDADDKEKINRLSALLVQKEQKIRELSEENDELQFQLEKKNSPVLNVAKAPSPDKDDMALDFESVSTFPISPPVRQNPEDDDKKMPATTTRKRTQPKKSQPPAKKQRRKK